jgi:hypothetical protein
LELKSTGKGKAVRLGNGMAGSGPRRGKRQAGQTGAESWTVLADPEVNELCIVRPKETLIG